MTAEARVSLAIDSDGGVDDLLALSAAAGRQDVSIAAVSAVFGAVPAGRAAATLQSATEGLGLCVPVAVGAPGPRDGGAAPLGRAHGTDGLWGGAAALEAPSLRLDPRPAPELLAARLRRPRAALLALGPATNLAAVFEPGGPGADLPADLPVVMMAGAPAAQPVDFNAAADPEALAVLLAAGRRPMLVGLDVTLQVRLPADLFAALETDARPVRRALATGLAGYRAFYARERRRDAVFAHDAVAFAALAAPELFRFEDRRLRVATDGSERGRLSPDPGGDPARVAVAVDVAGVLSFLRAALLGAAAP